MASFAASTTGTAPSAARRPRAAQVEKQKLVDMLSTIHSTLTAMSSTLTTLSDRVNTMDSRIGRIEEQKASEQGLPAAKRPRRGAPSPTGPPPSGNAAEATEAMAALTRAKAAAEEAAARCQAEKESLRATLIAIRDACQCPILHDFSADMVVASDGEGYDRQAIKQWQRGNNTSPVTRGRLKKKVYPNRFARRVFDELQKVGISQEPSSSAASAAIPGEPPREAQGPGALSDAESLEPPVLRAAIEAEDEAAALWLLGQPHVPDLNDLDEDGRTVLHLAIEKDLSSAAEEIVSTQGFYEIDAQDPAGCTALHLAACRNFRQVCEAICAHNNFTKLLAKNANGRTALQEAYIKGHHATATFLIDREYSARRAQR